MHMPFQPLPNHVTCLNTVVRIYHKAFFAKWDALAKLKDLAHIFTFFIRITLVWYSKCANISSESK